MSGARYLKTRNAISVQQRAMLEEVLSTHERMALGLADELPCIRVAAREDRHPGSAAYSRAWRLVRRGYLAATRIGNRVELEITDKGRIKLGVMVPGG